MVSLPLPVATCVAALVSAIAATLGGVAARGSTAVPAAAWATAACLAFAIESATRAAGALADPATAASARLGVSALAMAPAMSLLGAKRPQHGVWQLIVASLAVVLVMPAASALLVRPGSLPDIHLLERGFLLVLALVGWMNFVGTRRWAAATLVAAGQLAIIRPFLPLVATADALPQQLVDCVGGWLVAAGAALAAVQAFRPKPAAPPGPAALVTPPFLALRETLGAAWALRIAERFDTVAASRGWPCRLRFDGLDVGGDPADGSWHRDALRAFAALMHRFVTDDWLARHGHPGRYDP
jgi:hypothetical protein